MKLAVKQHDTLKKAPFSKNDETIDSDATATPNRFRLATIVKGIARLQNFKKLGEFADSNVRRRKPPSSSKSPTYELSSAHLTTDNIPMTSFRSTVLKAGKIMRGRQNEATASKNREIRSRQGGRQPAYKATPADVSPPTRRADKPSDRQSRAERSAKAQETINQVADLEVRKTNAYFDAVKRSVLMAMENDTNQLTLRRSHIHSFSIE